MPQATKPERIVNCPNCGAKMGTTPDGHHLRAGKGSVLKGKAAELHTTEGLLPMEVEGHGAMEVGCLGCSASFTVADVLSKPAQNGETGSPPASNS